VSGVSARLRQALRGAVALASLWYIGAYLVIACLRAGYRYELEWMEGGSLEHVARILSGHPLYGPPTLEFTPFIYAPLYYLVAVPFVKLFGLRLVSLRLVSIAASIGILVLLAALVYRRTRSRMGGLVAAGIFAATFERAGSWFDVARVDSLALFLTLLALWLLLADNDRHDIVAGLLLAAAFLTKQSMALVALPVGLASLRGGSGGGWRRFRCLAALLGAAALGVLVLHLRSHGWSSYYLFTLPAAHGWVRDQWVGYWRDDLFGALPVAMVALSLVIAGGAPAAYPRRLVELAAVLGCLAESWSSRLHSGGYTNVLMPAYAAIAWQAGALFATLTDANRPASTVRFACLACLAQLALLWFSPDRQVPTAADRAAGDALVSELAAIPGPVLIPFHPYLARLAGKPTSAHEMALGDVMRGGKPRVAAALADDIRQRLGARKFAAIVLDREWWTPDLTASYVEARRLFPNQPSVFWPRTGWPVRPTDLYVARP
jgi:hypothetical protein